MRETSKHTPGPWEIRDLQTGHGPVLLNDRNKIVATFDTGGPNDADASLIAAAPDLLATLEAISTAWGNLERKPVPTKHPAYGTGETYLSPAGRMIAAELIEQARAAIAKAKGK
jgi:hypothetical protein